MALGVQIGVLLLMNLGEEDCWESDWQVETVHEDKREEEGGWGESWKVLTGGFEERNDGSFAEEYGDK